MRLSILAVAAVAALGAGLTNVTSVAGTGKNLMGKDAPAFTVESWINGDGRTSLEDYRGDVVLLEFWKTH